jgi:hypothetical protein
MPVQRLKFVKPTKDCRKTYIRGREVVRWAYFYDDARVQHFAYAITSDCVAYKMPSETVLAEQRPLRRPEDAHVRGSTWGTSPARQRAYSKLMQACRKDFAQGGRSTNGENTMSDKELEMAERICQLRAALASTASMLEDVLENGFPTKGRSQDEKESAEQWREDRYMAVKKAELVLEATAEYAGVLVR